MTIEIKKCAICGGDKIEKTLNKDRSISFRCRGCGITTKNTQKHGAPKKAYGKKSMRRK